MPAQASSSGGVPKWTGDMLGDPAMVEAFATQLRGMLRRYADYVAGIRREAEAMWRANPPDGYSSFEAWWRHHQVCAPLRDIEKHLQDATAKTLALEARYRRNRHELPARRQAAAAGRHAPALNPGPATDRPALRRPAGGAPATTTPEASGPPGGHTFLDILNAKRDTA